jgi:uracil-DNA glycosylase family protein
MASASLARTPPENRPVAALQSARNGDVDLADVRRAAEGCHACDLWARATQTVFGTGPVPARLMLVGEQPGDREDIEGEPFVGPAGAVLARALEEAGIDRERAFETNVVKHFKWKPTPGGKRRLHEKPNKVEVGACLPWVQAELELVRPEALVLLGATALGALAGDELSVMRDRGRALDLPHAPLVATTVHPSSILRSGEGRELAYKAFVRDLRFVARWLERRGASPG